LVAESLGSPIRRGPMLLVTSVIAVEAITRLATTQVPKTAKEMMILVLEQVYSKMEVRWTPAIQTPAIQTPAVQIPAAQAPAVG
jgi:hypothetical protein